MYFHSPYQSSKAYKSTNVYICKRTKHGISFMCFPLWSVGFFILFFFWCISPYFHPLPVLVLHGSYQVHTGWLYLYHYLISSCFYSFDLDCGTFVSCVFSWFCFSSHMPSCPNIDVISMYSTVWGFLVNGRMAFAKHVKSQKSKHGAFFCNYADLEKQILY